MNLFGTDHPSVFISIDNLTINVEINPRPEPPTDTEEEMEDLQDEVHDMSVNFDRLSAAVQGLPSVVAGIETTLQHQADLIRSLQNQPGGPTDAQLGALADALENSKSQLASDIIANTDAVDEIPSAPVDVPVDTGTDSGTGVDTGGNSIDSGAGNDALVE